MSQGKDPIADLMVECGLDPEENAGVVDTLESMRGLVPERAPVPSRELAALLARGVATSLPMQPRHRADRPRAAAMVAAVAATVALGTGVAAASNTLPEPAQRVLSDLSEKILPFHIPSPEERDDGWRPDDDPFSHQAPGQRGEGHARVRDSGVDSAKGASGAGVDDALLPAEPTPGDEGGVLGVLPTGVVPTEAGETSPPEDQAQGAPEEEPATPDGGDVAEPADSGTETPNAGTRPGWGVVEPPKGKPTAPPGQGKDRHADDPLPDPPDDDQANSSTGTATVVEKSRKDAAGP